VLLLIGFRNRFAVMFEWFWAYLTRERSARLITGDAEELRDALTAIASTEAVSVVEKLNRKKASTASSKT
jgi:NADH dehydrogenase